MNSDIDFLMISPTSSKNKKRKTRTPNQPLPDDLLLSCFARVSRLYYPTLSLVSKSFQTLVASPELYKTRSLLNQWESCLYICLKFVHDPNRRWFTLCRKPNQTLTKRKTTKSSGYVLVAVPIIHSRPPSNQLLCNGLVAVGSNICILHESSSSVSVLDCKFHTWHEAPDMLTKIDRKFHKWREAPEILMKRNYPAVNVVDGKIYVAGSSEDFDSSNWMEVFDPTSQSWEPVSIPSSKRSDSHKHKSAAIEGEIYTLRHRGVSYKPKNGWSSKWDMLSYSVIDNVLYRYHDCGIKWYNSKIGQWVHLKGLEGLPKFASYGYIKLVDYGGKMAVFWDKYTASNGRKNTTIWCAVISLERHNTREIWGKVEWFDAMLIVPKSFEYVGAVAVTV